jgi:hypothetical protein
LLTFNWQINCLAVMNYGTTRTQWRPEWGIRTDFFISIFFFQHRTDRFVPLRESIGDCRKNRWKVNRFSGGRHVRTRLLPVSSLFLSSEVTFPSFFPHFSTVNIIRRLRRVASESVQNAVGLEPQPKMTTAPMTLFRNFSPKLIGTLDSPSTTEK